jgi:hypothetical protein
MSLDPDAIYRQLEKAGNDWADKKAGFEALDRVTKSVLSDVLVSFMDQGLSRAEAEARSLSSGQYKEHLASVSRAHKAYLQAQVLWNNLQTLAELRRSEESTRRAEINLR